jgi:outer membrane receptor protein involved in Fe transport
MKPKPTPSSSLERAKKIVSACLAASIAAGTLHAQTPTADSVRQLQEENAALRKRLAELEGRASPPPAATAPAPAPSTPASPAPVATRAPAPAATTGGLNEEGITVLSPFEVRNEKDYGYLKTNSVTATRIGMPIQNTPISVSVMPKDLLDDANIRSITDIFRYSSSGSGDNRFAMARPANSATPQGTFTMRGFGINSLLRNGVSRYIGYNVNNVDRVEVVKGPASVFFGSGYPGGVVNYITKQPSFNKIPTTISYTVGSDNVNRALLDNNTVLSKNAAMRVVGSWENSQGQRAFEYNKTNSLTANIAFVPFESGKLRLTAEIEAYDSKFNQNQSDWIYPTGWFQAYANPTPALIAAANLSGNADPVAAYRARIFASPGNWIADQRIASGNLSQPLYTQVVDGAYYQDKSGARIHNKGFNYTNRGSYSKQHVDTGTFTLEASPLSWFDARYVFTSENGVFDNKEGYITANADGRTFNAQTALASSGYYRKVKNHQFDLIFKADKWGIKNKLLVGGVFVDQMQQYNANSPFTPNYSQIPGATNSIANPGVIITGTTATGGQFPVNTNTGDVPVNQVIRDRFGAIKTVQQVFTQWDPGAEIHPDSAKLLLYDRTLLDGYKTQDQSGYVNYNASLLDNRLTVLAGVRREMHRDSGQYLTSNFPWFSPPPYAYTDQTAYPPGVYNYTPSYSGGYDQFFRQAGTSYMGGLSFEVLKNVNVFTSYSKTFRLNTGNAGGIGLTDIAPMWDAARTYLATQGKNSFTYNGSTINSAETLQAALSAAGALTKVPNETGTNLELGVKTSLWDNKLVGTFSLFHAERFNQRFDDTARQLAEPLNYGNNLAIFGPAGTASPDGLARANSRVIRWRTVGVKNRIQGADFDFIYSPMRNFQSVLNGAWMWTAKTVDDPTRAKPGSTAYNAASAAAKIASDIYFGSRIENVPEFRLNSINKYTFTDGFARGLSLGLIARYSSKTVVSRSVDWNPMAGGFQAGNFLVFDFNAGYAWELVGYRVNSSLGIYNLLDKKYFEGTYVASPRQSLLLTNTLKF